MCGKTGETIQYIVGVCEPLMVEEYKARQDSVAKVVDTAIVKHWKMSLEIKSFWEYEPAKVIENKEVLVLVGHDYGHAQDSNV